MSAEVWPAAGCLAGGGRVRGAPYRALEKRRVCAWGKSGAAPLPRLQQVRLRELGGAQILAAGRRHEPSELSVAGVAGAAALACAAGPRRRECWLKKAFCSLGERGRTDGLWDGE